MEPLKIVPESVAGTSVRDIAVSIGDLALDCGEVLSAAVQHVTVYGNFSNPAVLIAHALTGTSRVREWWPSIVGEGSVFDPNEWCVIGINALGSCYGSTGPGTYREMFPRITVRDIVRAQVRALDELGVLRLEFVVGGSLGGMQALQWALAFPGRVHNAVVVGAHDHFTALGIAFNAVQRECLVLDPVRGVRTARKLAMLTYKCDATLRRRHGRLPDRHGRPYFDIEGYLDYQADIFENRMDAATYTSLTHAMDSFDVRTNAEHAPPFTPQISFVGISSDWLFLPQDVRAAAIRLGSLGHSIRYFEFKSDDGHDAFLADQAELGAFLLRVLKKSQWPPGHLRSTQRGQQ